MLPLRARLPRLPHHDPPHCQRLSSRSASARGRAAEQWVYFGTRATEPGQSIYAARFDAKTGRLTPVGVVAEVNRPTWLLAHPTLPALYAVSDPAGEAQGESNVFRFGVDKATGKLSVLNSGASGGGGATHLTFDADGSAVVHGHEEWRAHPGQSRWSFRLCPQSRCHAMQVFSVEPASGKLTPGEAWLPMNQPSNVTFLP